MCGKAQGNDKMKIVILGGYPMDKIHGGDRIYGGVETHTYYLIRHMSMLNNVELHVVMLGMDNESFRRDNVYFHIIKTSSRCLYPIYMTRLRNAIFKIGPDIVHVQGTFFIYSMVAASFRDIFPTIITVHGLTAIEFKFETGLRYFICRFVSKPLEKYALSKIKNVIICSPATRYIIENMTKSDIYIIPNGINLEDVDSDIQIVLKHPCIIFVGAIRRLKGTDVLLNAVSIVKKSIPDICVYIAGSGIEETDMKNMVEKMNLVDNVKFLGHVQKKYIYPYIRSTDVLILPSRYETFGIVLLEAMVCSRPIVASNIGGIPYVVEDGKTGLLFESGNVTDLAEKIIILLKDEKLRKKMGNAGRKNADKFKWETIAMRTFLTYRNIVDHCQ